MKERMTPIKAARFRACLTGRAAAVAIGVHWSWLSNLERGKVKSVRSDVLWRMAQVYGCPVADLLEALHGPAEGVAANA